MGANELKCNMIEEWKYIPNTNNRYKISNIGNILSLCNGRQRILKPYITNKGYARTCIRFSNGKKSVLVHRLVADSFLEHIDGINEINHKDGNKQNNSIDNLEYCTSKYNTWHKYHVLGYCHSESTRNKISLWHKGRKLSEDVRKKISIGHTGKKRSAESVQKGAIKRCKKVVQYDLYMNQIATFNSIKEASIATHTNPSGISSVCNGKNHTYNGFIWSFIKENV